MVYRHRERTPQPRAAMAMPPIPFAASTYSYIREYDYVVSDAPTGRMNAIANTESTKEYDYAVSNFQQQQPLSPVAGSPGADVHYILLLPEQQSISGPKSPVINTEANSNDDNARNNFQQPAAAAAADGGIDDEPADAYVALSYDHAGNRASQPAYARINPNAFTHL